MRFLRLSIKKIQKEKIVWAGPYNKARETYHRTEIKVKETHTIFGNWLDADSSNLAPFKKKQKILDKKMKKK